MRSKIKRAFVFSEPKFFDDGDLTPDACMPESVEYDEEFVRIAKSVEMAECMSGGSALRAMIYHENSSLKYELAETRKALRKIEAELLKARLLADGRWLDAHSEPPKMDGVYLAYSENDVYPGVTIMEYREGGFWFRHYWGNQAYEFHWERAVYVTHYTPLNAEPMSEYDKVFAKIDIKRQEEQDERKVR